MNTFTVNIKRNGEYVPLGATAVFPFSLGELLDERLDEAYITFYGSKVKAYRPTTEFKISVIDSYETTDYYFILAGDNSAEYPAGSGRYKHSCYLIERTKWLEGIVCSSLTFRNALGNNYLLNAHQLPPINFSGFDGENESFGYDILYPIVSPQKLDSKVAIPSCLDICELLINSQNAPYPQGSFRLYASGTTAGDDPARIDVSILGQESTYSYDSTPELTLTSDAVITYTFYVQWFSASGGQQGGPRTYVMQYLLTVAENRLPLRRFTITDVVNRCLELAEPLFMGQKPKYVFDGVKYVDGEIAPYSEASKYRPGSMADIFDKVYAPEFNLTQDTLREQLKVIGGYIHGEPWIDENNVVYYQIFSDNARSRLEGHPNIGTSASWHINEYNTELRSNAQNLVSSLGYAKGVITDPGATLHRTLRTFPHCFIPLPNCI